MASMYETTQIGKRQEIKDAVFRVDTDGVILLPLLKVGPKPKASLCTWQVEKYPDVASTGVLDGATASTPSRVDRKLLTGCVQQFRQQWGVTPRAELTEIAGIKSEAAHQMMLAMDLLKVQMEQQFLSADDSSVEDGQTPWTARGVFSWLDSDAQTNHTVDSTFRPAAACHYEAAIASYAESSFQTQLEAMALAKKSAVNLDGLVDPTVHGILDDFTNVHPVASTTSQPRVVYQVRGNSEYLNKVDILRTNAGTVRLHTSFRLYATTSTGAAGAGYYGAFLDLSMWEVAYMAKPANTNLAADGSGKKGYVDAFATLKCLNPLGQGFIIGS